MLNTRCCHRLLILCNTEFRACLTLIIFSNPLVLILSAEIVSMSARILLVFFILSCGLSTNSQPLYSANFESATLDSAFQPISGNWHIADVQQLRIAPAENGRQFVLRSDSAGLIRLFIDVPLSKKPAKLKLSFSYYTYSQYHGPRFETEFYKKEMKDGLRGKPTRVNLPVKGMWSIYSKTFTIPPDANNFRIVFNNPRSSNAKSPCLDAIMVSLVK
jgi:hypothetical protein